LCVGVVDQDISKTLTTDLKEYLLTRIDRQQSPNFVEPEPPSPTLLCTQALAPFMCKTLLTDGAFSREAQGQGSSKTTAKTNQKKKVKVLYRYGFK